MRRNSLSALAANASKICLAGTLFVALNTHANADYNSWKAAFSPLPTTAESPSNPITAAKVALGKSLYSDTRLSKANDISCNSCHNLNTFGVDNEQTSPGHKGQRGGRNSPTVFNAALHIAQFWDGRAKDVEEQALGPILNPIEMAMESEQVVVDKLAQDPKTVAAFKEAFPDDATPLSYANIGKAIGAFERTLLTPSRFDSFLKGYENALTPEEQAGGRLFVQTGCTACHMGATLGGTMYQKLGLVKDYPTEDMGRYEVTKNEIDKKVFKVPSLRNVAKTEPYFHDGSVKTLNEAIAKMGEYQLAKKLSSDDIKSIAVFLATLTAEQSNN